MDNPNNTSSSSELSQLLYTMNKDGGFPISVLTDSAGLAIASAAEAGMNADKQSAVVAFIQKTAVQVSKQIGFTDSEEISLYDKDGRHLICRSFRANNFDLILSVIVPDRSTSYRHITTVAIKNIVEIWSRYWEK
jgi:predicted regulator of Ras-like GTPase activity (Roadblock/LC7/MglB family)